MASVLQEIIDHKRAEIARLREPHAGALSPADRDFVSALRRPGPAIIAEIKRRSPSTGPLRETCDPREIAQTYERGGAAAISVLTDARYFGGAPEDLDSARRATTLPALRKDFLLEPVQVSRSRAMGADACLLIVSALDRPKLRDLKRRIEDLGMTALIEVHDERQLDIALAEDPQIVGVNNRDLRDLTIDPETIQRLAPLIPESIVVVSESGVPGPAFLRTLPRRVDAVLIGTALMRSPDPIGFLEQAARCLEERR